jgi:PAS domain S-box-containing protein
METKREQPSLPATRRRPPGERSKRKSIVAIERTPEENQQLLREVQLHQGELQAENEKLRRAQAELEAALRRYATLYEFVPVGILTLGPDGAIRWANRTGVQLLGLHTSTPVNRHFGFFLAAETRADFNAFLARVFEGRAEESCEVKIFKESNHAIWAHMEAAATADGQECRAVLVDVTERRQVEEKLRDSENRFRELFDNINAGVAIYEAVENGADFVFKDFNRAGQRIERTPREQVLCRRVTDVFPGVRPMGLLDVFQRVWRTGQAEHYPATIYRDDHLIGWRENYVCKLPSGELVAVYEDITERKRAEEQLNALSLSLLKAQDEERRRLAHELHDEFGQLLAVSKVAAHEMHVRLTAEHHELGEAAGRLHRDIERAIDAARTIQRGLYPTILDHLGLSDAIETLVNDFQEQTGVACVLDLDEEPLEFDVHRQRALYRIVQEALTNVVRHSGATEVDIDIHRQGTRLHVEIRDDGRGIDPAKLSALNSYGLMGMRKRAELCGGSLEICGKAGEGTVLSLDIPLGPVV